MKNNNNDKVTFINPRTKKEITIAPGMWIRVEGGQFNGIHKIEQIGKTRRVRTEGGNFANENIDVYVDEFEKDTHLIADTGYIANYRDKIDDASFRLLDIIKVDDIIITEKGMGIVDSIYDDGPRFGFRSRNFRHIKNDDEIIAVINRETKELKDYLKYGQYHQREEV